MKVIAITSLPKPTNRFEAITTVSTWNDNTLTNIYQTDDHILEVVKTIKGPDYLLTLFPVKTPYLNKVGRLQPLDDMTFQTHINYNLNDIGVNNNIRLYLSTYQRLEPLTESQEKILRRRRVIGSIPTILKGGNRSSRLGKSRFK